MWLEWTLAVCDVRPLQLLGIRRAEAWALKQFAIKKCWLACWQRRWHFGSGESNHSGDPKPHIGITASSGETAGVGDHNLIDSYLREPCVQLQAKYEASSSTIMYSWRWTAHKQSLTGGRWPVRPAQWCEGLHVGMVWGWPAACRADHPRHAHWVNTADGHRCKSSRRSETSSVTHTLNDRRWNAEPYNWPGLLLRLYSAANSHAVGRNHIAHYTEDSQGFEPRITVSEGRHCNLPSQSSQRMLGLH